MKSRLIILSLGLSPPGTMGGNSKITVEMARCLDGKREVHFILPENKLATLTDNVPSNHGIHIHTIAAFTGEDKLNPLTSIKWFMPRLRIILKDISAGPNDYLYCCSDFHVDVVPPYVLQKEFGFRWLPSVFLFVPFVFENLSRGYKFPAIKYIIYWFYQRTLFTLMKRRATGFVVTNRSDFARFPKRFANKLFDYYGGVNIEQIPPPHSNIPTFEHSNIPTFEHSNNLSVVFCSRLHPQKGIDAFLDTWKEVLRLLSNRTIEHSNIQTFKLSVIGNGDPSYERYLKEKANRLGIADTIEWLGYVNNEAKFRIYAKSRVFVHPTVFDNNGMVAAEALCTGLPVVMQDLPALRDVYTTGCLKVPFGDRNAFAAAVVSLLTDPAKYAATAPNPDQLAALRAHWKWESRAAEFDQWLDSLTCTPNGEMLSYPHAQGTRDVIHDRQPNDGRGLHPFASRRERALSDLSRVRVLAEAFASQPSGASDSSPRDSLRKVIEIAKAHGLYITVPSPPSATGVVTGELISKRTGESEVYFNATERAYYKVKWPAAKAHIKHTTERDWLYEHIIHNILFPDTAYDFIGITEEVGELKIILRQQEVQSESAPSDAQIAAHLVSLGLTPEDRFFFGNDLLAVTDVSAQSDNVLLDDAGNLRFIDPLIRLKKPAVDVIDSLVGGCIQ